MSRYTSVSFECGTVSMHSDAEGLELMHYRINVVLKLNS